MIYRPITKETGMPRHRRAFLSGEVDDQVSVRSAGDTSDEATPKYIRLRRNGPSYYMERRHSSLGYRTPWSVFAGFEMIGSKVAVPNKF